MRLPEILRPLMRQDQWVIWRWVGETKPPFQAKYPNKHASVADPSTWSSYEEARKGARQADGVGFILKDSNIGALDLDDCRDPKTGKLDAWARDLVKRANGTYVELTPSGRGLRIIGKSVNGGVRHTRRRIGEGRVEVFCNAPRYITVTGKQLGECEKLADIDELADEILRERQPEKKDATPSGLFFSECCKLFDREWSIDRIVREFEEHRARYKHTSAGRYEESGRLEKEVKRCYDKWIVDRPAPKPSDLTSTRGDQVDMRRIRWLWPNRFAIGKIGLIAGPPDQGKSQVAIDMIARVTWGKPWPDGGYAPEGDAVVLSAEDDVEDTLAPRLTAAGANMRRVHIIKMVKREGQDRMFSLNDDIELLGQKIKTLDHVRMILIDPVTAYLGVGKVDSYRTSDVRGVLMPLADLAMRLRIAVICISHFNKNDKTSAINRVTDSLAFVATARHTYAVIRDTEDEDRMLFLKIKNNLASREAGSKGLSFSIEGRTVGADIRTSGIVWDKELINMTVDEALQQTREQQQHGPAGVQRQAARTFILETLKKGDVEEAKIRQMGEARNFSYMTLRRASKDLGVNKYQQNRQWWWELSTN